VAACARACAKLSSVTVCALRSGANLQEVIMSKAYAVNANFQGARGLPVPPPVSAVANAAHVLTCEALQEARPVRQHLSSCRG